MLRNIFLKTKILRIHCQIPLFQKNSNEITSEGLGLPPQVPEKVKGVGVGGGCTREGGARNAGPRDGTEAELARLQTRCSCSRQRPSPPPGRRPSPRRQPSRASPAPPRLRTQRRVTSRRYRGLGGARWARGRRWGR